MVTLKQLAKELNVSISTVSKALNNSDEIGEETIRRVKELAELYNYKPNKVALSLKQNKTKTIGVIIPNILNHFMAKVLFGIEREAGLHGYNIITCISNESLNKEKEGFQLLANGSVDGFILALAKETQIKNEIAHFKKTLDSGFPIVMFDRVAYDVQCDKVIVDDFDSTYNATKYLINEGRNNICFITTFDGLSVGKLREQGYNKAILEENNQQLLTLKIDKHEDSQERIKEFFENNSVDGVLSADNATGIIAINTAINMGLQVPNDISVIGFSSKYISSHSIPKLTIIRQHAKDMGAFAAKLLINRLQNSALPANKTTTKIVKTSFVKNGSTL